MHIRSGILFKYLLLIVIFGVSIHFEAKSQDVFIPEKGNPSFIYDETSVFVVLEGYGNFDLDVLYTNNDILYVNVRDLFRTLNIPCFIGQNGDSIGGFTEKESRSYVIDYNRKQIKIGDKIIHTKTGW